MVPTPASAAPMPASAQRRDGVVVWSAPPASVEARSERTGFCVVTVVIAVPFEVVGVR